MAEKSLFFNSVNGDRRYLAGDFADYFSPLVTNGFFPADLNLKVLAHENMDVVIKSGRAWINGYQYINTSDLVASIDIADGVLNRIDRVVVQLSFLDREIRVVVKKGIPASSPVPPPVTRNADIYELGIATISVPAGITVLSQSHITDTRNDVTVGGIVNNLFADANAQAKNVILDDINNFYISDNAEGALIELGQDLRITKTNEDDGGKFTTVTWRNTAGIVVKRSVLSNPDADGNYLTRTVIYYAADGTTVRRSRVFNVVYNADGNVIDEVPV